MPLTIILPQLADLVVDDVNLEAEIVTIAARVSGDVACCPGCGGASHRVHSRYQRTIADLPLAGYRVTIHLLVRRFRCVDPACPRATVAE